MYVVPIGAPAPIRIFKRSAFKSKNIYSSWQKLLLIWLTLCKNFRLRRFSLLQVAQFIWLWIIIYKAFINNDTSFIKSSP